MHYNTGIAFRCPVEQSFKRRHMEEQLPLMTPVCLFWQHSRHWVHAS